MIGPSAVEAEAAFETHPLTPDRWHDLEQLFGARGAYSGCWCMWWRVAGKDWSAQRGEGNRVAFKEVVESGEVPGILGYVNGQPAGWCAIAPRDAHMRLREERVRIFKRVDDQPVWTVTCFYIGLGCRGNALPGVWGCPPKFFLFFPSWRAGGSPIADRSMMKEDKRDIGAAILAGGLSRRMGGNKALLRLHDAGPTIIETVVTKLRRAGLPAPLLVANRPKEYDFLGLECLPDEIEGLGALGGILTALSHSQHSRVLVVACDMPLLNVALLKHMARIEGDYDALVPRWLDGEEVRVEPLHAIYSTGCLQAIRKDVERGQLKVTDFLNEIDVAYLAEDEIRRYDPDLRSFSNVNTPEEWEALKHL